MTRGLAHALVLYFTNDELSHRFVVSSCWQSRSIDAFAACLGFADGFLRPARRPHWIKFARDYTAWVDESRTMIDQLLDTPVKTEEMTPLCVELWAWLQFRVWRLLQITLNWTVVPCPMSYSLALQVGFPSSLPSRWNNASFNFHGFFASLDRVIYQLLSIKFSF